LYPLLKNVSHDEKLKKRSSEIRKRHSLVEMRGGETAAKKVGTGRAQSPCLGSGFTRKFTHIPIILRTRGQQSKVVCLKNPVNKGCDRT